MEELAFGQVAALIEVTTALEPRKGFLLLHETLVVLLLKILVPLEDVERAVVVLGVVTPLAAAADGVADLPLLALVVEAVEQELGSVVPVAVVEVLEVDDVLVFDAPRVSRVPSAEDEGRGQNLVPELP